MLETNHHGYLKYIWRFQGFSRIKMYLYESIEIPNLGSLPTKRRKHFYLFSYTIFVYWIFLASFGINLFAKECFLLIAICYSSKCCLFSDKQFSLISTHKHKKAEQTKGHWGHSTQDIWFLSHSKMSRKNGFYHLQNGTLRCVFA